MKAHAEYVVIVVLQLSLTLTLTLYIENDIDILGLILKLILIGKPMLILLDTEPRKCLMYILFPSSKL